VRVGKESIHTIHTEVSPPLDSIIYWFLKKSVNLYGEALVRTMADRQSASGNKSPSTSNGVNLVATFWSEKGIAPAALHLVDGSGLSPLNRVTTKAQVQVLQYAKGRPWFPGYYAAFPEYNGMKMKSGTISGVKSFCGYHTSASGTTYIFSFIVNNYNGSSSGLVRKMYAVLDALK
jgi:serine-type D-Ala-D-Ala carboxypeptidase/endopeptidase (penicillin-binding protein 4)